MDKPYITDQVTRENVLCHKCGLFIIAGEGHRYPESDFLKDDVWFHVNCYNRYEHYYGLDKPID